MMRGPVAGPAHGWRQDRVQSATGPPSVFLILSLPLPLFHYMCAPLLVCMTTIIIIIIGRSARISVDTKTQTQTNQLLLNLCCACAPRINNATPRGALTVLSLFCCLWFLFAFSFVFFIQERVWYGALSF